MFASIESKFRSWRRRFSRNEWAIRNLGLTPIEGQSEEPGLLLIQIDGLARRQLEDAIAKGKMPFLKRLRDRGHYAMHTFYPGIPTTTPAVQAELYYGVRAGVPAFSFLDRETGATGMMFQPEWAKKFEARFQADHEGLLKGGSSWSNIYSGGAAPEETHFCGASIAFSDMWRTGKIRNIFVFIALHIPSVIKIAGLLLLELAISVPQAVRGILRGQWPSQEFGMVISRTFIGIGLRELITIGGQVDVTRGLPAVHVNFLGYDELSHRRGPGSRFAHWSLKGIDRSIKNLYRAAQRSTRRDYSVFIFSDHGQERARSFATEFPGGIHKITTDALAAEQIVTEATVAALGPIGHAYFKPELTDLQKHAVARRLVDDGKVPGVLHRDANGRITWLHAQGETSVPEGVPAMLANHPEPLRAEIARDLVTFCENKDCGDLVLVGWSPAGSWTFAPERGSHASIGPDETQGFLLVPPGTRLPADAIDFVRPSDLRAAGLALLGRQPLTSARHAGARNETHLRVMTYNTHSCSGMDGRVSPRRIARIIQQQSADIVALQELDLGRSRSRGEDQATLVAEALGYHVVFCPTVKHSQSEHYGHALVSRWPIEIIKVGELPNAPNSWFPEARGALWARIEVNGVNLNIVTTHLGLSPRERLAQMNALLGPDWLGPVIATEPVILCGDFNLSPGSAPYGLAASKLRDVQAARSGHRPRSTFSSTKPFMRIDHIFVSAHFETERAFVPRNDLTRLASDHLPLLADLSFSSAGDGTTTRT
ncbi:endonuclease/exonuclease/phosphatase family protein [Rariglobus hedericola]|uniref:Endonuclease n=1 Tax=Rariglobus hedericola TaxID=2597822 RepID=A0A556QGL1_9BACT|nr:endonuclease/exonuclease/phosphatase family protein [Rariglobus hedericola]TSJ75780.1 endonuclease [Rariglobus hedericola]